MLQATVSNCLSFFVGGGVYALGFFIMQQSLLSGNTAYNQGANGWAGSGALINASTITLGTSNTLTGGFTQTGAQGGTYINSVFTNNTCGAAASGLYHTGDMVMQNCTFIDNLAIGGDGGAMGIFPPSNNILISDSTFVNNAAAVRAATCYARHANARMAHAHSRAHPARLGQRRTAAALSSSLRCPPPPRCPSCASSAAPSTTTMPASASRAASTSSRP
jgi:hypothetical protein